MALYNQLKSIIFGLILLSLFACGSAKDNPPLSVSGHVDTGTLDTSSMGPVFVAVLGSDPVTNLDTISDSLLAIQSVDVNEGNYYLDLTESGKEAGDVVYIVAIVDNDFSNGIPLPNVGDYIGYYLDAEKFSPAYVLSSGSNTGLDISVTREVFDFDASLSGTVCGEGTGNLTVFAYAGEIDSLSISAIDPDNIVGYTTIAKNSDDPVDYTFSILPFGVTLPIEGVYLMAYLDVNGNEIPDGGDRLGFYSGTRSLPQTLTINEGSTTGLDLSLSYTLSDTSGDSIQLKGSIEIPASLESTLSQGRFFLVVARADDDTDLMAMAQGDFSDLVSFYAFEEGSRDFDLDLSETGLSEGDKVALIAVCDMDGTQGFPEINAGDYLGYYMNTELMGPQFVLSSGVNSGIMITVDKEVFDYQSSLSGTVGEGYTGTATIFAYTGSFDSLDFSQFDLSSVIGYTTVELTGEAAGFTVEIMPFGQNVPIEDVYLMIFVDVNGNGIMDSHDLFGFYMGDSGVPTLLTVTEGDLSGLSLTPSMEIPEASGDTLGISGTITVPDDLSSVIGNRELFVLVMDASQGVPDFDAMTSGDLSGMVYFEKLGASVCDFDLDLSGTGLAAGDSVMVVALCDLQYEKGFPVMSTGDYLGYYINPEKLGPELFLEDGGNTGIDITLSKEIFDYNASLSGVVSGTGTGELLIFAYAGAIDSLDFTNLDLEAVIGYSTVAKTGETANFTVDILPFGYNVPIENVFLLAFLDSNGNSYPDAGDMVGFVADDNGLPALLTVASGTTNDLFIDLSMTLPEPSGYSMSLSGTVNVSLPSGVDISGLPLFILVVESGDDMDFSGLMEGDLTDVASFEKLPAGTRDFDIDLSETGLAPGDEVMILVLCDLAYTAGFPYPDEGDYMGFYQDTEAMDVNYTLQEGENTVSNSGNTDFTLSKIVYDHQSSVLFELDDQNLNALRPSVSLDAGEHVTVVAIQSDGVDTSTYDIDMDYIVGFGSVTIPEGGNDGQVYTMDILPVIDHHIAVGTPFAIDGVYIFAIFDGNTNGDSDQNNYLGFYWETTIWSFGVMVPKELDTLSDGENTLDKTVRFTTRQM